MKARGLVVVVAFLLAAGATAGVFLYVREVKEGAKAGGEQVSVVVSTQDIAAGTELSELIDEGVFAERQVPPDLVVPGAVTEVSQLDGLTTTQAIVAGEQIPRARLAGLGTVPGGALGIPEGFTALTMSVPAAEGVGANLHRGDHVTMYATFRNLDGTPGQVKTVALVPDVLVLDVLSSAEDGRTTSDQLLVTVALKPGAASRVVFTQEQGSVWLALLPPDAQAKKKQPAVTINEVAK